MSAHVVTGLDLARWRDSTGFEDAWRREREDNRGSAAGGAKKKAAEHLGKTAGTAVTPEQLRIAIGTSSPPPSRLLNNAA
jgi:hypothetical protein